MIRAGDLLWSPSPERVRAARMTSYIDWLVARTGRRFDDYQELHRWSVSDLDAFWRSIWDYFEVEFAGRFERALGQSEMPGATWFEGSRLSLVEHVFRNKRSDRPAILACSEAGDHRELSWAELEAGVAAVAAWLRDRGVRPGDRVVGYLPNIPEAVIAFLAVANVGAIWSCCSPDFGTKSVLDRFQQISPKILFAADGYRYGGHAFDRAEVAAEIATGLPSLSGIVTVPVLGSPTKQRFTPWSEVLSLHVPLKQQRFDFSHPLWIVYTSGTTGLPKAIVHSQGGVLLETLKAAALQLDVGPEERFFWFTTTGWIMWNLLVGVLLVGATIVLYDGSPAYPDLGALWRMADILGVTWFGTSAAFLTGCLRAGLVPGHDHDLSRMRTIGSTGSPLSPDGFGWVYEDVKRDVWLASVSGGTDVDTAFVGGSPLLPVHAGELQCRYLGVDAHAFDPHGKALIGKVGELVIAQPMPSMPLRFWNDPGDQRYLDSYFRQFPGAWRHGDYITFTERGSAIIFGRSDSTIKRAGVRFGTSDIYDLVERLPDIADSLVVDVDTGGDRSEVILFVVIADGAAYGSELVERLKSEIRLQLSPRHVPDKVIKIQSVPRTLNGKKLEVPVKRLLMGMRVEDAVGASAMANPEALEYFVELGNELAAARAAKG